MRTAKSNYFLQLITCSYENPSTFWKAVNSFKNSPASSLPSHIDCGNYIISDSNEICLDFNKHFADAGYLFDKEYSGPPIINVDYACTLNQASCFSLEPFSVSAVLAALQAIDPRSSTGEDKLKLAKTGCTFSCRSAFAYF